MRLFSATAVVCAALFSGTTLLHAQEDPELLAKRQCRSVHVMQQGHPAQASALYNEVKAKTSVPGTYFCAMNFDDGYIGFQEQSNGKKVIIFSIWDPVAHGDNPNSVPEEERTKLVKLGENARSGRFGGEGTGGQSFVDYPWTVGENMRFLVCVKKMGKFKEISGYYFNNKDKSWDLISKWKTHSSEKELSFSVGFVEDFMRNFESAKKARGAFFGPSFAYKDGKWHPNTSVTFTGEPTPSTNVMADIQPNGSVLLQTGGETKMTDFKLFQNRPLPQDANPVQPDEVVTRLVQENIK